jgi:hypothetical protein
MKVLIPILLTALFSLPATAAEEKYAPDAATRMLQDACEKAKRDAKLVFVVSGFKECSWCRVFERYHATPEVAQIIGKYYEVVKIDTTYMPDGKVVFSKLAQPGAPSWVIITPERKVIADSYAKTGNVGYPVEPHESDHYLKALKKATPQITEPELKTLAEQIQKAAGRRSS